MTRVLFLGAHTDDIEHGAGGYLGFLLGRTGVEVRCLSFSRCLDLPRNKGILKEQVNAGKYIQTKGGQSYILDFENRFFYKSSDSIRAELELHRDEFNPDVVCTHWREDRHQDHRVVFDESARVFRGKTLLEYECLASCQSFVPSVYIPLSPSQFEEKLFLLSFYKTQASCFYNKPELLRSLAIVRGHAVQAPFAEGFYSSNINLGVFSG